MDERIYGDGCTTHIESPGATVPYLSVTVRLAEPPRLLLTVMFCGLVGQAKSPRYRPPPSLRKVPINVLVALT